MIKGLSKLKNMPGMTVSNARNDFINHLVPMSTEAEDCGLRVDICLSCSRAAEAINTLLKHSTRGIGTKLLTNFCDKQTPLTMVSGQ